jgi:phage baseplate assembly protein W
VTAITPDAGQILGRGIAFPPRVGTDGRVQFSAGEPNIREAIEIVLRTALRERLRLAEFGTGLDRFLFEPNTTATRRQIEDRIGKALQTWEPRIVVQSIAVDEDPDDPEAAVATIVYRLVATQASERVSVSVAVGG